MELSKWHPWDPGGQVVYPLIGPVVTFFGSHSPQKVYIAFDVVFEGLVLRFRGSCHSRKQGPEHSTSIGARYDLQFALEASGDTFEPLL
jgi:hypothetical protein